MNEQTTVAIVDGVEPPTALTAAAERSGYLTATPDDLVAWAAGDGPRAVVLAVRETVDTETLGRLLAAQPALPVVALLANPEPGGFQAVLLAGAGAGVARDAHPDTVVRVLDAVVRGEHFRHQEPAAALA